MTNDMRGSPAGLRCPACQVDLVMSERQGVEIDYCPRCRGVWLDRGELDKILERSVADLAPPQAAPGYRQDDDRDRGRRDEYKHDYKHHKHGRRSFLHDLFD